MNIAFYCMCSGGGTERATSNIANRLLQYQHSVHIINIYRDEPHFALDDRICYAQICESNKAKQILSVAKYLKRNKMDVLVVIEAMGGLSAYPAAKLAGCAVVIWEHANYYQNQGISYIQKVRQFELKHCDAYIVLTDKDKRYFEQFFSIHTRLRRIYNIAPALSDAPYSLESKTIISVGHIHRIKNFIAIPDIGKLVFSRYPDWRWKIYGAPSGKEYEKIKRKIEEYNLQDYIIFAGRSDSIQEEYQKASMYVMTSLQEGLPMVLLEAKANKLPLISFDIQTGPDEIIRDGINGYLIEPYDVEQMAEKICGLIESKDLRQSMSDRSCLDLEKFHADPIMEQWMNLLNDISLGINKSQETASSRPIF